MRPEPPECTPQPSDPEAIRAQLRKILASPAFSHSPKLSRFLELTVEHALAGHREESLKEYWLGVEIYERQPSYDPRTDPIVRVEARRLRTKLQQYYETQGATDPVRIDYPKGSYGPAFEFRRGEIRPTPAAPRRLARLRRAVAWLAAADVLLVGGFVAHWMRQPAKVTVDPVLTRLTTDPGLTAWPALSADGKLVAYASDRGPDGHLHIWVHPLASTEALQLTHAPADDTEPAFSPNGRQIAFRSERQGGGIYLVPAAGGEATLFTPRGRWPRFSPDGKSIAYWVAAEDSGLAGPDQAGDSVYVAPSSGGQPRRLASEFAEASRPVWSPDGNRLMFRGRIEPRGPHNWWIADLDTGSITPSDAPFVLIRRGTYQHLPWGYRAYDWVGDRILCSARLGEVHQVWQLRLAPGTWKATGEAEHLTSGTGFEIQPSMVEKSGGPSTLAFTNSSASINIWSLPVDANLGRVTGNLQPITQEVDTWVAYPSFSGDGSKVVHNYVKSRASTEVWIRDLGSGWKAALSPKPVVLSHARMSGDGSRVAYQHEEAGMKAIYAVDVSVWTGAGRRICVDCGLPTDWSLDNRRLLFRTTSALPRVSLLEVASGERNDVLGHPSLGLYGARFSPSGDWIAFYARGETSASQVFLTNFSSGNGDDHRAWIAVTDGSTKDSVPCWAPDGNLLYVLSERDGFRCIWAQRLDRASKRPAGDPFAVRHFHGPRHSLLWTIHSPPEAVGLSVTRDRLIFALDDLTGNIWTAQWTHPPSGGR